MSLISFIPNSPWTLVGMLAGLASGPTNFKWKKQPPAVVMNVKGFWWYSWLPGTKNVRAMALGNVVLLGPNILPNDFEHELVHVEQAMKAPLVHPILYWIESIRKGYRQNKYEKEAYGKAQNIYISTEWSFGNDELADQLKNLVLNGKKTATTGFLKPDTKIPATGEYSAILDRNKRRFCVIQYTKIEVKPFMEVDWEFAKLEGENDNLDEWRNEHRRYFSKYYPDFSDESSVICEEFKLIAKQN